MRELKSIYRRIRQTENEQFALATVVNVAGSAYRKPGARMLVCADGSSVGSVSGGCIEADLRERCLRAIKSNGLETVTYDGALDRSVYGFGMGCNGTVEVLIQPFQARGNNPTMAFLDSLLVRRKSAALVTAIPISQQENRFDCRDIRFMTITAPGDVCGSLGNTDIDEAMAHELAALLGTRSNSITLRTLPIGHYRIIIESNLPPTHLVISGCGLDAVPLAAFGSALGWDVTLIDRRRGSAVPERFVADAKIICAEAGILRTIVDGSSSAAIVIMNHHFENDKAALCAICDSSPGYIGVLGPAARTERMIYEISNEGNHVPVAMLSKIHTPIGLEIGAEGPEQIALSIASEIQAVMSERRNGRAPEQPAVSSRISKFLRSKQTLELLS